VNPYDEWVVVAGALHHPDDLPTTRELAEDDWLTHQEEEEERR